MPNRWARLGTAEERLQREFDGHRFHDIALRLRGRSASGELAALIHSLSFFFILFYFVVVLFVVVAQNQKTWSNLFDRGHGIWHYPLVKTIILFKTK